MAQLPAIKKRWSDVHSRIWHSIASTGRVVVYGTFAALNLFGVGKSQGFESPSSPGSATTVALITNRERKETKLVLKLAQDDDAIPAQHRSHSSHSSHRSHSSHYSSRSPAPPPYQQPAPTPAPPDVVAEQRVDVVIKKIDKEKRILAGVDELETSFEFQYRDDTKVTDSSGTTHRLDEYLEANAGVLPFDVGQKVRVAWKSSSDKKKRIAVTITILPQ